MSDTLVTMEALQATLLLLVSGLALADPQTFHVDIEEMGWEFTETIVLDEDSNTEVFVVPHHNEVMATTFIHDFNKNLTLRRIESSGQCFLNDFSEMRTNGYMSPPHILKVNMVAGQHRSDSASSVEVVLQDWVMGREVSAEERAALSAKQRDACSDTPIIWLYLLEDHARVRHEEHTTHNYSSHGLSRHRRQDDFMPTCPPGQMKYRCKRNILNCQYIYYETCDAEAYRRQTRRWAKCKDKNTLHVIDQVVCCKECCAQEDLADCFFPFCDKVGNFECDDPISTC